MTLALTAIMPSFQPQSARLPRPTAAEAPSAAAPAPPVQAAVEPAAPVAARAPETPAQDDVETQTIAIVPSSPEPPAAPATSDEPAPAKTAERPPGVQKEARREEPADAFAVGSLGRDSPRNDLSYLAYYAYAEVAPETKPAVVVLNSLKSTPPGTPIDEIKRVSALLGLNFVFMKTVAKIESNFDPKQRTGSYIGLFQISKKEFDKYGVGDIRNPRDNVAAAAMKILAEAALFEMFTNRTPTLNDLYLIHQQGVDGASEHVSHPQRLAWRSMCATEEGKQKGERWCKQAIWANTIPAVKRAHKTVNNISSGAFVAMWQERVAHFYARYSQASAN